MTHTLRLARFAGIGLALPVLGIVACSSTPATTTSTGTGSGGATSTASGSGGAGQGGHGGQTGPGGAGSQSAQSSSGSGSSTGSGPVDPCATAVYCDNFDAYAPGGDPGGKWVTSKNNGSISVDTTRAHSGANSVKFTADKASGYRSVMIALKDKSLLPVAGNVVYGRMMFWLESAPQGTVHWTFLDGQGPVPNQPYTAVYRYGGQLPITQNGTFVGSQMMANYDSPSSYGNPPVGPSSDCWLHSDKKVVPVGAWTCAEWRFDGPNNEMHFWMDGVEVPDLTMKDTGQGCVHQPQSYVWDAPSFERLDLGWESYQADEARTMWVDDVVISTTRVGCPMP
jgi:hypothetical protein